MEEQIEQLISLIEKGLTQMANNLGIAFPQLWEILIKQQYIEAAQAFILLGICLIIIKIYYTKRAIINKSQFFDADTPVCLIGFCSVIAFLVIFIISIICSVEAVGQILNPEYYAIQDITEFIGNLTNNK